MIKAVYNRGKYKQVYKHIIRPFEKNISFSFANNAQYDKRDILNSVLCASMSNGSIEASYVDFEELGRKKKMPSADTVLNYLGSKSWDEVLSDFEKVLDFQLQFAKDAGLIEEESYLAGDIHKVPRYVKEGKGKRRREDLKMVVGTENKKGTSRAHAIMTTEIIGKKGSLTLGVEPIFPLSNMNEIIRRLVTKAQRYTKIKTLLMDRGFFNCKVVGLLEKTEVPYCIPAIRNKRIKKLRNDASARRYTAKDFEFGLEKVKTEIVTVRTDSLNKKGKDNYFTFITNTEIKKYTDAVELARLYSLRWGIETGYRTKKNFRAKTCSLSYSVRLFLILTSIILYNQWVILKLILEKNRILFGRFKYNVPNHIVKLIFQLYLMQLYGLISLIRQ